MKKVHFVGIGGAGMSALAQIARWRGQPVSGSDRDFDRGLVPDLRACLEKEGIEIVPQDGSGLSGAGEVVSSAAVEADIPDLQEALRRGVPILGRGEYLLRLVEDRRSLAVAGTNGKSTTTALLSWILEKNNYDPTSVIGARLKRVAKGWGNARLGNSEWFCFEADESDGLLPQYQPAVGVITNISLDHFVIDELRTIFHDFARGCRDGLALNADCPESENLKDSSVRTITFSVNTPADYRAREIELFPDRSTFRVSGGKFLIPLPGLHNVYNALAAMAVASEAGLPPDDIARALSSFPGLRRRMEVVHSSPDLTVVEDYSHNPATIAAALATARFLGPRITAVYQPHGFGPLRRFHREVAGAFSGGLRDCDRLILLPVYYAGGTVQPGFGSEDLAGETCGPGEVVVQTDRDELLSWLERRARKGEVILVMGARDPTLSDLARHIARQLSL